MKTAPPSPGMLDGEQPLSELEELRNLVSTGRERGYLTFEEIADNLEEVELSKNRSASCTPTWSITASM